MPTTSRSRLRIPTLKGFLKLTLEQRTRLFGRWLKAQPRDKAYVFANCGTCALAQFAKLIYRSRKAEGCTYTIDDGQERNAAVPVFPDIDDLRYSLHERTFGAASDRFRAMLKRHGVFAKAARLRY